MQTPTKQIRPPWLLLSTESESASEVKAANRIITHEQRKRFQAALGNEAGYFQVRSCLRTGS